MLKSTENRSFLIALVIVYAASGLIAEVSVKLAGVAL
jgi:hypothetical protein